MPLFIYMDSNTKEEYFIFNLLSLAINFTYFSHSMYWKAVFKDISIYFHTFAEAWVTVGCRWEVSVGGGEGTFGVSRTGLDTEGMFPPI